jgi:hypothetical protein
VDSFTKLDPNAIPPELRPYYESMQADYTRKTQSLAESRKQLEGLGDLDEAQTAVDLLHSLGTPEGALTFHRLLSEQLQSLGLSPAEADYAATQQIQQQGPAAPSPSFDDDPEAALKYELDQVRGELAAMQNTWHEEQARAQAETQYYALAGELQRQESMVRESNPHYTDDDINAVYELAASTGGNLVQAQQRYESIVSDRVARLLNSKQVAQQATGVHPVGTPGYAEPAPHFETLDQAHAGALEYLRHVQNEG